MLGVEDKVAHFFYDIFHFRVSIFGRWVECVPLDDYIFGLVCQDALNVAQLFARLPQNLRSSFVLAAHDVDVGEAWGEAAWRAGWWRLEWKCRGWWQL